MGEPWIAPLEAGDSETAWDLFIERYRRLVFSAIRHYARDYDDVMDVFAHVCAALRDKDFARLRRYLAEPDHRAQFSTWLVAVVRNQTIDWFRQRDGRPRLTALAAALPPLRQRIFELVFLDGRSHLETYELLRERDKPDLSFRDFLKELGATYRAVSAGRQGRLLVELSGPLPDLPADAPEDDPTTRREQSALLTKALEALPAEDRVAVQLYVVEEMPAEQVARALGLPNAKAVYNCVYRALATVRASLERVGIHRGDL
ncbi:MAG TPA: sigma-70 family RNA polymerase sigma factor [Gemmatimonadales bacterium]